MSEFPELVLKEYTAIPKRITPTKEVSYRIRVLKRKDQEGLFRLFFEVREFIVTERKALFTESGIYVTKDQLDYLIKVMQEARKDFFTVKGNEDGTRSGTGSANSYPTKAQE